MRSRLAAALSLAVTLSGAAIAQAPPALPPFAKPAVAALAQAKPPAAFPILVNPISLPTAAHPGWVALFVKIPGEGLTAAQDLKTGTFTAGAAIVARLVNAAGVVVHQEARELPLNGLLSDARTLLSKPMETSWQFEVPSAKYTLQVAVYDEGGKSASVVVRPFEVPALEIPIVGDIMVVDYAKKIPDGETPDPGNPLILPNRAMLHPSFEPGVNRGLQSELNFAIAMMLTPGAPLPASTLALLAENGAPLAAVNLPLSQPDANGWLMAVGRIPLARIPPGKYTVQLTIGTAPHARVRTIPIGVVD